MEEQYREKIATVQTETKCELDKLEPKLKQIRKERNKLKDEFDKVLKDKR